MKPFANYFWLIPFLACDIVAAQDSITKTNPIVTAQNHIQQMWGGATNGLSSYLLVERYDTGWEFFLGFLAQTNFSSHRWLDITNRVGSKLELWQTNGASIVSKKPDVLDAFHLPKQTTVSEVMRHSSIPRAQRAYQWWLVGRPVNVGTTYESLSFKLQSVFDVTLTNDYLLQVTPLLYKVETNETTAHLIEYPPIKIKLMANGDVQKLN
jgi:hypothetical protein